MADALILRPMKDDEFVSFRNDFIEDWAKDLSENDDLPLAEARVDAARRTDADLQDGVDSEGQRLYVIALGSETIGRLWFSFASGRAFLAEVCIFEQFRGNGYGRRAIELMEDELQALEVSLVQLTVDSSNTRAQSLYQTSGYEITGLRMRKRLGANTATPRTPQAPRSSTSSKRPIA